MLASTSFRRASALMRSPCFRRPLSLGMINNVQATRPIVPHLHDLIGDDSQPGLGGAFGVKAVALRQVAQGEVIFRERGHLYRMASMHSIQIGVNTHCQIDGEGRFAMHSFSPNCAVVVSPTNDTPIEFIAMRTIPKGEPLSFNYTTTEWELENSGFVDCVSGEAVKGFKHLSDARRNELLEAGLLPAHIMQLWLQERQESSPAGVTA